MSSSSSSSVPSLSSFIEPLGFSEEIMIERFYSQYSFPNLCEECAIQQFQNYQAFANYSENSLFQNNSNEETCADHEDHEDSYFDNNYDEQQDKCGVRRYKPRQNPRLIKSLGLKNYIKMYICRNPRSDKETAIRKARCAYENLSERTKQRYRAMGCDFECCPRRKAQAAPPKKVCKKPKRKPRKKCPPMACPTNSLTNEDSTTDILEENSNSEGIQE